MFCWQIDALVTALVQQRQDSHQRRSLLAAQRSVYHEDYDDDALETEEIKDEEEIEMCYLVRAVFFMHLLQADVSRLAMSLTGVSSATPRGFHGYLLALLFACWACQLV